MKVSEEIHTEKRLVMGKVMCIQMTNPFGEKSQKKMDIESRGQNQHMVSLLFYLKKIIFWRKSLPSQVLKY